MWGGGSSQPCVGHADKNKKLKSITPLFFPTTTTPLSWTAVYRVIPDDRPTIEAALRAMVDDDGCAVVVTTGGTGPAPRDVTPEATEAVCDRLLPGYGEQMRAISLAHVPTAVLSRQVGGTRGSCLILNLPGNPKAIRETIDTVFASVPTCVDLIGGPYLEVGGPVKPFRPCSMVRKTG